MRLLLAANNQPPDEMKSLKATLKLGSSSNRYAPRLPQQETKSSTKQLAPTDPILGPEKLLKIGFAQKGLPSTHESEFSESEVADMGCVLARSCDSCTHMSHGFVV